MKARAASPPPDALIRRYQTLGYTDAFAVVVPRQIGHADFVRAFFASAAFLPERTVLFGIGKTGSRASLDAVADGTGDGHAAWHVEVRVPDQVLLCDFLSYTRCWLMTEAAGPSATRVWFGTAIVARRTRRDGKPRLTRGFQALLPFHRRYAPILLIGAARRLERAAAR